MNTTKELIIDAIAIIIVWIFIALFDKWKAKYENKNNDDDHKKVRDK